MKKLHVIFTIAAFTILTGCTTVNVNKVDANNHKINRVCIKENPKVLVDDFISVMEDGFMEHGIDSIVFEGGRPNNCEYMVTYTARRSWDMTPYLSFAEIKIRHNGKSIGSATYKHEGGSMSLALNKWASTREKMAPVLNKLLADF